MIPKKTLLLMAFYGLALLAASKPAFPIYITPKIPDSVNAKNMHQADIWNHIPLSGDFGFFPLGRKDKPTAQTHFRAAYNSNGLLLQVICDEPLASTLDFSHQIAQHDDSGAVFSKPVIEVFLDPSFLRNVGAHFVLNIGGATFDRLNSNVAWNFAYPFKIVPAPKSYTFYLLFPWVETNHENPEVYIFSMTPTANPVIGFNVAREQTVGNGELTQWNPGTVTFLNPKCFGALVLAQQPNLKNRMMRLFTNEILAGGLDIQGDYPKLRHIFLEFLKDKIETGQTMAKDLTSKERNDYDREFRQLKQQMKDAGNQQLNQLIRKAVKLNADLEEHFFKKLQQQIFDEI